MSDNKAVGCGCLVGLLFGILAIGGTIYYLRVHIPIKTREMMVQFSSKHFWHEKTTVSEYGYLLSSADIPIRAIARRPNVLLYSKLGGSRRNGVSALMTPWKPYYVYEYDKDARAMRIHDGVIATEKVAELTSWVYEDDVYCWTTREVLSLERPFELYASKEDANEDRNPVLKSYDYPFTKHFAEGQEINGRVKLIKIAGLPVIRQEQGLYWAVLCPDPDPDPTADLPYPVYWVRWDGGSEGAVCRLLTTRREMDDFINGIHTLLRTWKAASQADRAGISEDIMETGQAVITQEKGSGRYDMTSLNRRKIGIPKLTAGVIKPIENELEYSNMVKRLDKMLRLSSSDDIWGVDDVGYIPLEEMP